MALFGQTVQQLVLVECLHLDQPVDDLAGAVEDQPAVSVARHRDHALIEVRRCPPVQRKFARARRFSELQRREIGIGEPDRALQLQGAVARQKDVRNMRGDDLDGVAGPASAFEEGDDIRLAGVGAFGLYRIAQVGLASSMRHQDRDVRMPQNMARHAAQNSLAEATVRIGAHDDQGCVAFGRSA